ncbi:PP2C family serine/threonine-protein phosphatase [Kitasatospora sp. DSM 101779]|uniref:PP2C family serine/threonine-protein phosphatase n=1 Tax=Kitasatospora sp. DSM 101779 TaxID=2853165 RepID=UPI0021DB5CD1|nr:protein phosphatase 2C domain-containing protein [Kitasatospora sp. DSM 101779]MCU7824262.1 protein phosphatase 2C domain-containing protein [Kitasatospora sp. DSM 101779]
MNEEHGGRADAVHLAEHGAGPVGEWPFVQPRAVQWTEQSEPAPPSWPHRAPQAQPAQQPPQYGNYGDYGDYVDYTGGYRAEPAAPLWEPAGAPAVPDAGYAPPAPGRRQSAAVEETVPIAVLPPDADRPGRQPAPGPAAHTGARPPAYPAEPGELTEVGSDLFAAMVPDTVVDGGTVGAAAVRAVSVRGDSHRYAKECRQDSVLLVRVGGLAVLAVADGVGSARYSHRGSAGACRLLVSCLISQADRLTAALLAGDRNAFASCAGVVMGRVAARLQEEADKQDHAPADYATTLRALLVPTDPQHPVRGFLAVGDGGLFRLRAGHWTSLERSADEGAVFDTGTDALPVNFGAPVAELITDGLPGDLLVMCTDGLSNPLVKEPDVAEFLARQWGAGQVPGLTDFLWQTQIRARSYDDDRSVVCLWEGAR